MNQAYQRDFRNAILRTGKFRMHAPFEDIVRFPTERRTFETKENKQGAFLHVHKSLDKFTSDDVTAQCIRYSLFSKPYFDEYLNAKTVITLGSLIDDGKEHFKFDDAYIYRRITSAANLENTANIHVWLTLPSFEIIDLTYLESKKNIAGKPFSKETCFEYIFSNAQSIYTDKDILYRPMLVGEDALAKMKFEVKIRTETGA